MDLQWISKAKHSLDASPRTQLTIPALSTMLSLFDLPGELRTRIYEYVFGPAANIPFCQIKRVSSASTKPQVALLSVNRQLNKETTSFFYSRYWFTKVEVYGNFIEDSIRHIGLQTAVRDFERLKQCSRFSASIKLIDFNSTNPQEERYSLVVAACDLPLIAVLLWDYYLPLYATSVSPTGIPRNNLHLHIVVHDSSRTRAAKQQILIEPLRHFCKFDTVYIKGRIHYMDAKGLKEVLRSSEWNIQTMTDELETILALVRVFDHQKTHLEPSVLSRYWDHVRENISEEYLVGVDCISSVKYMHLLFTLQAYEVYMEYRYGDPIIATYYAFHMDHTWGVGHEEHGKGGLIDIYYGQTCWLLGMLFLREDSLMPTSSFRICAIRALQFAGEETPIFALRSQLLLDGPPETVENEFTRIYPSTGGASWQDPGYEPALRKLLQSFTLEQLDQYISSKRVLNQLHHVASTWTI